MNTRLIALLTVFCCLLASNALALEVTGSASLGVFDKYLWRGFDLSDSTAVTQGAAELSAGGFTFGVWGNAQLQDDAGFDAGEVNEVDLTIGYSFDVTELFSVGIGNITYVLKNPPDTNEAYLGVTANTVLAPTVTVYYDWDEAEENGLFYTAAVSHAFEPCSHATVSLGALVSYNDESDYSIGNYSDWHNYELSASADIKLGERWTLTPLLVYSSPLSDEAKLAIDSEWLAGLNLTYAFSF